MRATTLSGLLAMRHYTSLAALFACVAACADDSAPGAVARPLIDLRLVSVDSTASSERVQHEGEVLFLDRESIVSDDDFVEAEVYESTLDQGRLQLRYELTPEGARRLRTATAARLGMRLALLVDGRVTTVAVIRDEIGGRGVAVLGLEGEEAERITQLIRDRWPPSDPGNP